MKKFLGQLLLFAIAFLGIWWGLSLIPWREKLSIKSSAKEWQEDLAEMILDLHRANRKELSDSAFLKPIFAISDELCRANHLDTANIRLHVFEDGQVNAFALPGGHLVIHSELIAYCDNPEMLAGVMAHEIAHLELDHVSQKLIKEIGLNTLVALSGGAQNAGLLKQVLYTLSSRGFDRKMEAEADRLAVRYMRNANLDSRQLAFFLQKLSDRSPDLPEALQWISTHPDLENRVTEILKQSDELFLPQTLIDEDSWNKIKGWPN